ncbi:aldehyde dehydrogenase family protein [Streptomyces sp. NPDC044780]|uniref:aldehyde dehydrogenase family protein n=1 Tax=unclassified Streptomyces TaxID=2593676 RepID=UPI0033F06D56
MTAAQQISQAATQDATREDGAGWDALIRPLNPTTLTPLPEIQPTTADELDAVASSAAAGLRTWAADPRRRSRVMRDWAEALRADAGELSADLVAETGKPITEARTEVAAAADALEYNAGLTRIHLGTAGSLPDGSVSHVVREPVGPSLFLVPWNWPVLLLLRDVAPALAAGVTCIVKPSPQTSHVTTRVLRLGRRAGLPEEVVQVVYGDVAVAQHLLHDPRMRAVAFTGSTKVGEAVLRSTADRMLRPLLELGGKNAAVVLPDADLDSALPTLARAAVITAGQMCMACSRLLVHRSVHREAVGAVRDTLRAMRLGDPAKDATEIGPLVSPAHAASVMGHIDGVRGQAGVSGGELVHPDGIAGHAVTPAIVDDPDRDAAIIHTDVFGPVLTIEPFDNEEDAVTRANVTRYGLVAAVWTGDPVRALRVAARLEAGTVWVNGWNTSYPDAPGGGMKSSGLGRVRGIHGVAQFTETKHIHLPVG